MRARINSLENIVKTQAATSISQNELLHKLAPSSPPHPQSHQTTTVNQPTHHRGLNQAHHHREESFIAAEIDSNIGTPHSSNQRSNPPQQPPNQSQQPSTHHGSNNNNRMQQNRPNVHGATNNDNPGPVDRQQRYMNSSQSKKSVMILGDSMLNGINEVGLRKDQFVQVRSEPGATSEDMVDYVLPRARARPDLIILHVGTNDLTKKSNIDPDIARNDRPLIDTTTCLKKVISTIKKDAPNTKIAFSLATPRYDRPNMIQRINELNDTIKGVCDTYELPYIEHRINKSHLSNGKLHCNDAGKSRMSKTFIDFIHEFDFELVAP